MIGYIYDYIYMSIHIYVYIYYNTYTQDGGVSQLMLKT